MIILAFLHELLLQEVDSIELPALFQKLKVLLLVYVILKQATEVP